ncbi:Endonuclease/exonuclease/phosphatase [Dichotomopilus funicola]|uniref:Endonuclease/exonuclease/phosphatase n=1 Tax=Dichotomopilus funicola TaxID=1934379 RepID=A0AAN6ZMH0_9PEZI|nr:Endonuclease/exonuclease/phosphatase [Dichotomopilus funicola]
MQDLPDDLRLITLNCWGLKYISKLRRERITEIGRQLSIASPQPHIVALQECFTQEDYKNIRRQTRFVLPYGKFYHSAAFGGGLAILSRWPIEGSTMYLYPLNGRPTAFWRGDWYVGKGIAHAKIRYGPAAKQVIEVFNTHTHAPYEGGKPNDSYLCHRTAQSWEMAKLLRGATERGHLTLAMGDFNMIPLSPEHQLITSLAPVRDVWRVMHPDSSLGPAHHPAEKARGRPVPTAEFNIQENGASSDGPYNTWRWTKSQQKMLGPGKHPTTVSPDTPDRLGKKLDYIFASSGDIQALGGAWVVKNVNVGMMMRHPELGCSLSDHFSIEATLTFHPLPEDQSPSPALSTGPNVDHLSNGPTTPAATDTLPRPLPEPTLGSAETAGADSTLRNGAYLQLQSPPPSLNHEPDSSSRAQLAFFLRHKHNSHNYASLPPTTYDTILAIIQTYASREQSQLTWRARRFFFALFASVACLVGVWFVPSGRNYISFILVLVSTLGLVAGTVEGLMALLFFRSELNALREFHWEVRNAKRALLAGDSGGLGGKGLSEFDAQ